ncbi:14599_t:CDS:2 [Ambispora leptoticha]|uniref:14599_t:CDS:1 n=1 Tax=Ambispora leptoticha TaxID=144679 RepID=A0A9N8V7U0_9GLOM|nr:14599_t:CDS:2 [Ambispora leptoticha]
MNFEDTDEGLVVVKSDGQFAVPPNETPEEDANGAINYYARIERGESKDILWREKLGMALADQLREKRGQQIRSRILKELPNGYSLYCHYSRRDQTVDLRKDVYLYGKVGSPRFRSPNEFAPHLYWLATNREEPCKCKYCGKLKNTPQVIVERKRTRMSITSTAVATIDKSNKKPNNVKISKKGKISRTFRLGEIVWFDISDASDSNFASIAGLVDLDNQDHVLRYWPSVIHHVGQEQRQLRQRPDTEGDKTLYTVQLLALSINEIVTKTSLRPWLFCRPTTLTKASTDSLVKVNKTNYQLLSYYEAYEKAINAVNNVIKSYCPRKDYVYVETRTRLKAVEEREKIRMNQMTAFPHYREIFFGAEKIREWDFVRLRPESQLSSSDGSTSSMANNEAATERNEYFHISTIYYHRGKGIQFTGDLYEMALPALTEKPTIEEHFNWIPLNETNEEYTIELSDVMGRFYVNYPNLDDSMPIKENNMKDENGRNELLAITKKRPLQGPESKQLVKKPKPHDNHSNRNSSRSSDKPQEKGKVASNKEAGKSTIADSARTTDGATSSLRPDNPPANVCWSGKISWPKSADQRSLQGAPSLSLHIPEKISWYFGIDIMAYSIPVVSTQKRNVYEHFPRNLTISAISNLAPFQAYDQSMGDLVHFFPDSNYPFPENNNLNFSVLAKTLENNNISAVASSGKLTVFFKSDDGTNIIGLCARDHRESTIQYSRNPASKNLQCVNIKNELQQTIEMSNLRNITDLIREIVEAFSIPLRGLKKPEDIGLRFLDKDQQLYHVLGTSSSYELPARADSKFTDSLDFVKEHAAKLIIEYEMQASI